MIRVKFTLLLLLISVILKAQPDSTSYSEKLLVMGMTFEVKAVSSSFDSSYHAVQLAIAEAHRIDTLLSSHIPGTYTNQINQFAGIHPVKVPTEMIQLVSRSKKISAITNGAFDLSFSAIGHLWKFNGEMKTLPNADTIAKYRSLINYKDIKVNTDSSTIFLKNKGTSIGFGGIGQGYAANRCKKAMVDYGIKCGYVDVSGDIIFWGKHADGSLWKVAIGSPKNRNEAVAWIELTDMAVVTSGDYEQYTIIDGKQYTHIIDPRTGYPANDIHSVAIICPDAELADGLSTGVFVLGEKDGLDLVNHLKNIECVMITGDYRLVTSDKLKLNFTTPENPHFKISNTKSKK